MTAAYNKDGDEVEIRRTRMAMRSPTTTVSSINKRCKMGVWILRPISIYNDWLILRRFANPSCPKYIGCLRYSEPRAIPPGKGSCAVLARPRGL